MKKKWSWKRAFYTLLVVNGIFLLFLLVLLMIPQKHGEFKTQNTDLNFQEAQITTNKADLNRLLNYYLEKESRSGRMDYQVLLNDSVEFYGILPIFNQSIEMQMTFHPEATESGDLILNQESISIGQLDLPVKYVMNFIKKTYDFPKEVEIFPNEELIYIHMTDMKFGKNIKMKVNEFDLENDNISFSLIMPESP